MSKIRSLISTLLGLLTLVALAVALTWLLGSQGPRPARQQVLPPPTPTGETASQSPLPTPTVPAPLPETPPIPAGKAATLHNGNLWLVEHSREPEALTDFGDASAIFGWNWDGTKLLFGRGRKQHEWEFVSDTTELWVIELASGAVKQLTTGSNVHTAVWSPVEDRLAYCDQEAGVKVISLAGELLYEIPNGGCIRSTWSPDGTALATAMYSKEDDPRPYDELENVKLVMVSFPDDLVTVLTDEGTPYAPVWSTDGRHILFQRMFVTMAFGETPWYLADVVTGDVTRLDNAPPLAGVDPVRSPRGDFVVVGIGEDFYVLDFAGNTLFTARGRGPVWAPDGRTIVYRDEANQLQTVPLPLEVRSSKVGGDLPAPVLYDYLRWKFFFAPSKSIGGDS